VAAGAFDRQIDAICHAGSAAGSIGPVGRAGATRSRPAGSAWRDLPNTRSYLRAMPDTLAMGRNMSKKTTISIVTQELQPVFWAQLLPCRRSRPRAPFAKLWRLAREFLCCELQNGMILPVCNSQRL
jgi:hypothetical protein